MNVSRFSLAAAYALCASLCASQTDANAAKDAPWTAQTSASIRRYEPPAVSPDGSHFFFIAHYGEWSSDSTVSELRLFSTEAVKAALENRRSQAAEPVRTVTLRSASSVYHAIENPTWEMDGTGILFVAPEENGLQLQRLDLRSGEIRQLTHRPSSLYTDVMWRFLEAYSHRNGGLVYLAQPPQSPTPYPMEPVARAPDGRVRLPADSTHYLNTYTEIFVSYLGGTARKLDLKVDAEFVRSRLWLAPDGRKALAVIAQNRFAILDIPAASVRIADTVRSRPYDSSELLKTQVFWSPDSSRALLFNAAVRSAAGAEQTAYVVDYEFATDTGRILETADAGSGRSGRRATGARWLKMGSEVLITRATGGKASAGTVYSWSNGQWHARTASATLSAQNASKPEGFGLSVNESLTQPPVVVASRGARQLILSPPDPVLQAVSVNPWKVVNWIAEDGMQVSGGLMLPKGYVGGTRLPVVIQNYPYFMDVFRGHFIPDGTSGVGTSDAAQLLAASGMAVFQIAYDSAKANYPDEGRDIVRRLDSTVAVLNKKGFIDPRRVAMTGFSRGGYQTHYTITHPAGTQLAAAVIADAFTASYPQYLIGSINSGEHDRSQYENLNDGNAQIPGFWQNKSSWLEQEVTFNVDRVRTPALFTRHGPDHYYSWYPLQTLGAYYLTGKPIEFLFFPSGDHVLMRPRERVALMESVVEWLSFWLQGTLPADPERAARWQALKEIHDKASRETSAGTAAAPAVTAR